MKTHKLTAELREIMGKKVKSLRKQGIAPANVFGKSRKSLAVQLNSKEFTTIYNTAGETGLIELAVKGQKEPLHVLVHHAQVHAVSGDLIHVDFHEVALKEKIKVMVPITLTGESPAANQKIGVLLHIENELEVEALPTNLPEEINININSLKEIGDEIKVADLPKNADYAVLTEPERTIVKINPLEKEEAPAPIVAPEGAEAEAPAEGETPEAETPTQEKKEEKAKE